MGTIHSKKFLFKGGIIGNDVHVLTTIDFGGKQITTTCERPIMTKALKSPIVELPL